ncbi:hypothetical protein ACR5KS_03535 [Leucobacter sp. W1153]|uniref:hypothetical protein n=1 Tax=Leucobacter sp. W1153 TaxID=3439064 RepID=UPI003F3C04BF
MTHPAQKISNENRGHLLADLRNVTAALTEAITHGIEVGAPNERELAVIVWLASRAQYEAVAALAQKLSVTDYVIREAMEDPESHPKLAARLGSLVDGLVEVI